MIAIICTAIACVAAWDVARRYINTRKPVDLTGTADVLNKITARIAMIESQQQAEQLAKLGRRGGQ